MEPTGETSTSIGFSRYFNNDFFSEDLLEAVRAEGVQKNLLVNIVTKYNRYGRESDSIASAVPHLLLPA